MEQVYLIGAGGHGKVVLDALVLLGCEPRLLDGDAALEGQRVLGRLVERDEKVLASLERPARFFVAVGDGSSRQRVVERWEARGHRLVRVVHPAARVSGFAALEEGVAVMAEAVVQADARVGKGAIINTGASVDHDCRIGEYVHIAPGARLGGGVEVGALAWIGIGSSVREGVAIGARTVIGAGSAVVDDLDPDVVAFGNPCRPVRRIGRPERPARSGEDLAG